MALFLKRRKLPSPPSSLSTPPSEQCTANFSKRMVSFSKKLHRNDGHFLRLLQQANEKPKNENFFPEWRALLSVVYVSKRFFYRYLLPAWKMGFLVGNLILVCTRAAGPLPHIPMGCCGLPIRAGWHTGPLSRFVFVVQFFVLAEKMIPILLLLNNI